MAYSQKISGCGYIYESLEQGYFRVILEDGRDYVLKGMNIKVGDIGNLVYCSDCASYGLNKFVPDNTVKINIEIAKENYIHRYNF